LKAFSSPVPPVPPFGLSNMVYFLACFANELISCDESSLCDFDCVLYNQEWYVQPMGGGVNCMSNTGLSHHTPGKCGGSRLWASMSQG
jgi:hypothetical protein